MYFMDPVLGPSDKMVWKGEKIMMPEDEKKYQAMWKEAREIAFLIVDFFCLRAKAKPVRKNASKSHVETMQNSSNNLLSYYIAISDSLKDAVLSALEALYQEACKVLSVMASVDPWFKKREKQGGLLKKDRERRIEEGKVKLIEYVKAEPKVEEEKEDKGEEKEDKEEEEEEKDDETDEKDEGGEDTTEGKDGEKGPEKKKRRVRRRDRRWTKEQEREAENQKLIDMLERLQECVRLLTILSASRPQLTSDRSPPPPPPSVPTVRKKRPYTKRAKKEEGKEAGANGQLDGDPHGEGQSEGTDEPEAKKVRVDGNGDGALDGVELAQPNVESNESKPEGGEEVAIRVEPNDGEDSVRATEGGGGGSPQAELATGEATEAGRPEEKEADGVAAEVPSPPFVGREDGDRSAEIAITAIATPGASADPARGEPASADPSEPQTGAEKESTDAPGFSLEAKQPNGGEGEQAGGEGEGDAEQLE